MASDMMTKRTGAGLFGDCRYTNLRSVNHYFPLRTRRTTKNPLRDRADAKGRRSTDIPGEIGQLSVGRERSAVTQGI